MSRPNLDTHASVTCEIVNFNINNFNINNFNRKSTKNAAIFVSCKCLVFLYIIFLLGILYVSYSQRNLHCISKKFHCS